MYWYILVALVCACAISIWRAEQNYAYPLGDLSPLYYGAQAWLQSGNAYQPESVVPPEYAASYLYRIGNGYPLPAILLVLPLSFLSPTQAATTWLALSTFGMVLALMLSRAPLWTLLYVPFWEAFWLQQYVLLVLIAQIVAIWAYRERRPWLLALCCAIMLTKPTSAFIAVVLLLLARNWRQQAIMVGMLWGGSVLLDPNWLGEWWQALQNYAEQGRQGSVWPLALLLLPLLLWRDYVSAAALAQLSLLPFAAVYDAAALPLNYLNDRRSWLLILASFAYIPLAVVFDRQIGIAIALILPVVVLSFLRRQSAVNRKDAKT
jgi:hypothetical protein